MPWKLDNKILTEGLAFSDNNGKSYPANWTLLSETEKKNLGMTFVEADTPKPYDEKFYWGRKANGDLIEKNLADEDAVDESGNKIKDADGNQIVNKGLKTVWKEKTKFQAKILLEPTDWYVTRKAEANTAIPNNITTYRGDVRTASKTIEDAIDATDTLAKFKELFNSPDGKKNAPINDWPTEVI